MVKLAYLSLTLFTLHISHVVSNGTQFITGPCDTDADCAEGCCGFNTGLCAGPIIALTRDGGCGHGDAQPNANAANALGQGTFTVSGAVATAAATQSAIAATQSAIAATQSAIAVTQSAIVAGSATTSSSGAKGTQFITGPCDTDADCAEGCCGFNTGKCAGPIVALERDGGCGHGDAQPNANAANALGQGTFTVSGAAAMVAATQSAIVAASATTSSSGAKGTQFITGPCDTDADCAEGCCGFNTGLCAGPIIALTRDGGCGHGDAQPNANAANALGQGTFTVSGAAATTAAGAAMQAATTAAGSGSAMTTNKGAGNGVGAQFITGPCDSDADCASGCCGFNTGKCAGAIVAQERDGGCGHGDPQPNDNAAQALRGGQKRGLWDD